VNQERCLDIVIVHGEGEQIKILTERFMAIKGIESVKLTTIQIEK
jgi:CopG family nickel-responsive transcriptional regulator